jgi:hypothetical protein
MMVRWQIITGFARAWSCFSLQLDRLVCGGPPAAQQLLARQGDRKLRVLVVWEPILATDWRPPSGSTLARITDNQVRQFWDPKHVVSATLKEHALRTPPQTKRDCCVQKGFYWDEAILYPARTSWKDAPTSVFWNGPIVKVTSSLEGKLRELP